MHPGASLETAGGHSASPRKIRPRAFRARLRRNLMKGRILRLKSDCLSRLSASQGEDAGGRTGQAKSMKTIGNNLDMRAMIRLQHNENKRLTWLSLEELRPTSGICGISTMGGQDEAEFHLHQ